MLKSDRLWKEKVCRNLHWRLEKEGKSRGAREIIGNARGAGPRLAKSSVASHVISKTTRMGLCSGLIVRRDSIHKATNMNSNPGRMSEVCLIYLSHSPIAFATFASSLVLKHSAESHCDPDG